MLRLFAFHSTADVSLLLSSNLQFTVQSFSSPACSGDDANAKVFRELLQEDEGEHCVRDQPDSCRNKTLPTETFAIRCWSASVQ